MAMTTWQIALIVLATAGAAALLGLALQLRGLARGQSEFRERLAQGLEDKHRDLLKDLHEGLARQGDRLGEALARTSGELRGALHERLETLGGRMEERLEDGLRQTSATFTSVMARLAAIDEAQKKIDGLTTSVVSLQELLGDKRSRGAFGEVQLEALVRNILPPQAYAMQHTLPNGARADCVLKLPEPTGMVAVDSKFPLENYHRMLASGIAESERLAAQRQFKADVRRHVEDISQKYILPNLTSDGAVMFVPAEAVFAEIHAYHSDLVDYALQKRVWIVSPTTLMAVLNTARAVIKDVETRRQVHVIKDELGKLGREFARFGERMRKLADHIRQAHEDVEKVHVTSQKITQRFAEIESVELGEPRESPVRLVEVNKND